ncbi:c-type cytochrome [Paraburkholderia humisilvae]|uniref:Thiosulfate dehydrogenase n=1 Tax=Paraburkholderia humisilvae TaxID=627669 RepID=A0A6J5FAB7_9BURK|nr:c-type cytochrome [Paraburkholderia humisilvae]CAB3774146.1 Thiosulfate dehydrogenase [Paraburkholderia humisilvae]
MNSRVAFPLIVVILAIAAVGIWIAGVGHRESSKTKTVVAMSTKSHVSSGTASVPAERPIPDGDFGRVIEQGRKIFNDPAIYAKSFVGNPLRCASCHLDEGRKAGASPMWAAYVSYPAYRSKNDQVNTFAERLQGCFRYSMNGKPPPLGDPVLVALEAYAYWLAQGMTINPKIAGRGFPSLAKPTLAPDYQRGSHVYTARCALCHGANGGGQRAANGSLAFPPLWGDQSYNWGAGMASVKNAAEFIKANMPLGLGGSLSDQDAWDVALFVDSHERPQDPRYTGSVEQTRIRFHDSAESMYGQTVNGYILGSHSTPSGGVLQRGE